MTSLYLLLDLDGTVWEKRSLDSQAFEAVSRDVFNIPISMLEHPVTGEPDMQFSNHSQREIWSYKIRQILDSDQELIFMPKSKPIRTVSDVDLDQLVARLGPAALQCYARKGLASVQFYFNSDTLTDVIQQTKPTVAACSLGARMLQNRLLSDAGLYDAGINRDLSTFGDEAQNKKALVQLAMDKYLARHSDSPTVVLVDDSPRATAAVRELQQEAYAGCQFHAVGVGFQEFHPAADVVIDTLSSGTDVKKLTTFLLSL